MTATKQRDTSLDIICGLLIIHMILEHIFFSFVLLRDSGAFQWERHILFFFMPWFFFKNGMFYKQNCELKIGMIKDFHRLIVPFLVWSLIGEVCWCLSEYLNGNFNYFESLKSLPINGHTKGNPALWFLLSLFMVRQLFSVVSRSKVIVTFVAIISLIVPYLCWKFDYNKYLIVSHTMLGFFFFTGGSYLREKQRLVHVIALAGVTLFIACLFSRPWMDMRANIITDPYLIGAVAAMAAILLVNTILPPHICRNPIGRVLAYIGKDSMSFYVVHWPLLWFLRIFLKRCMGITDSWDLVWCMIASAAVLLPLTVTLLKRYTKLL